MAWATVSRPSSPRLPDCATSGLRSLTGVGELGDRLSASGAQVEERTRACRQGPVPRTLGGKVVVAGAHGDVADGDLALQYQAFFGEAVVVSGHGTPGSRRARRERAPVVSSRYSILNWMPGMSSTHPYRTPDAQWLCTSRQRGAKDSMVKRSVVVRRETQNRPIRFRKAMK